MTVDTLLRRITGLIVQCCNPEEVLLFGSYAKGLATLDSDIDILVIADFAESPHLRRYEVHQLLSRYPIRIDLHLLTPRELAEAEEAPWSFPGCLSGSCVRLYRKASGIDNPVAARHDVPTGRT